MVVASLNHLAIARQNSSRRSSSPTSPRRLLPTAVQTAMLSSIGKRVARFGRPSPEATPESSLKEMMCVRDLYSQEPMHLAPFELSNLKVATGSTAPRPIASALPPGPKAFLDNFANCIEKTSAEIAAMEPGTLPAAPYQDPTLRQSRRQRRMLFKILFDLKLIAFRAMTKAFAGLFFVRKKSGMIRMVVDSRIANGCHRRPPRTRLSSAASLAGLDLPDAAIDSDGMGEVLEITPHGNEGDVVDCLYNSMVPSLASWFALDDPETVDEWPLLGFDIPEIYDDNKLGPHEASTAGGDLLAVRRSDEHGVELVAPPRERGGLPLCPPCSRTLVRRRAPGAVAGAFARLRSPHHRCLR